MKALVAIGVVTALLALVPFVTSSNVVLNFMVMALLIALVGQGWNVLGGYVGQYSFGHAAFFGTAAYTTGILQLHYGVNAWAGLVIGIAAGTLVGVLADHNLFLHARLLADYRLLGMFLGFDHPILKHGVARAHRTVDRFPLNLDGFVPQINLLADRRFDHVAANPHPAVIDVALAHAQLLFIDGDDLVFSLRHGGRRRGRSGQGRSGRCGCG